jgi:hypothetical protein
VVAIDAVGRNGVSIDSLGHDAERIGLDVERVRSSVD